MKSSEDRNAAKNSIEYSAVTYMEKESQKYA